MLTNRLTSRWVTGEIVEVSDGTHTMGLLARDVAHVWQVVHDAAGPGARLWKTFGSATNTYQKDGEEDGWGMAATQNDLRIEHDAVVWRMTYSIPVVGRVRKEVTWSREELEVELRAAQVAYRLRPTPTNAEVFAWRSITIPITLTKKP